MKEWNLENQISLCSYYGKCIEKGSCLFVKTNRPQKCAFNFHLLAKDKVYESIKECFVKELFIV